MTWLQQRKGGLPFILSDNDNYDYDVKFGRCGSVGFVNEVIDYECLGCIYIYIFLELKRKKKTHFISTFMYYIILQHYSCTVWLTY